MENETFEAGDRIEFKKREGRKESSTIIRRGALFPVSPGTKGTVKYGHKEHWIYLIIDGEIDVVKASPYAIRRLTALEIIQDRIDGTVDRAKRKADRLRRKRKWNSK